MTEPDQSLEALQRQLVSMNAPYELRTKMMATVTTADPEVMPAMCQALIAALEWMDEARQTNEMQ